MHVCAGVRIKVSDAFMTGLLDQSYVRAIGPNSLAPEVVPSAASILPLVSPNCQSISVYNWDLLVETGFLICQIRL